MMITTEIVLALKKAIEIIESKEKEKKQTEKDIINHYQKITRL